VALLVLGTGAVSLVLGLLAQTWASAVVGAISGLVGVLWLVNPIAVVSERALEIKNPLGLTLRTIPLESKRDLQVRDGKVFVKGGTRPVLAALVTHRPDVEELARWLAA
jgi:hypothetical protein